MRKKYSQEEVIQILRVCNSGNNGDCDDCPMRGSADCLDYNNERMALEVIEELLAEVKRLREESRWIPVAERLPDLDDGVALLDGELVAVQVLAMIQGAEKSTCLYFDGEDFFDYTGDELIPYRVTHWRPMPQKP